MPEDSNPQIEIIGAATAPRLSEEGIAYQKGLLADAKWCEEFPAHAAALRASLDNALAATGSEGRHEQRTWRSARRPGGRPRRAISPRGRWGRVALGRAIWGWPRGADAVNPPRARASPPAAAAVTATRGTLGRHVA